MHRAARQVQHVARRSYRPVAVKRVHLGSAVGRAQVELLARGEEWRQIGLPLATVEPLLAPEQLHDEDVGHVGVVRERGRAPLRIPPAVMLRVDVGDRRRRGCCALVLRAGGVVARERARVLACVVVVSCVRVVLVLRLVSARPGRLVLATRGRVRC